MYHNACKESEPTEVCTMKKTVEELLQCPYWINYFLQGDRLEEIKQKHIDLVLKLNCYRDISISDESVINPAPEHVADEMKRRYLYIMIDESMILSEPDDTHLTVFDPDPQLLELIRQLASGVGLYVWQPNF